MSEKVFIFDTTLRDGEQSPGCSMNFEEKLEMARQLARLNVDILEAGFPIASQGDFDAVKAVAAEIRRDVADAPCSRADQPLAAHPHVSCHLGHSPEIQTAKNP